MRFCKLIWSDFYNSKDFSLSATPIRNLKNKFIWTSVNFHLFISLHSGKLTSWITDYLNLATKQKQLILLLSIIIWSPEETVPVLFKKIEIQKSLTNNFFFFVSFYSWNIFNYKYIFHLTKWFTQSALSAESGSYFMRSEYTP